MSNRFTYAKYDTIATGKQQALKSLFEQVECAGDLALPDGWAKDNFFRALEEAYMWTGKGIRDDMASRVGLTSELKERSDG